MRSLKSHLLPCFALVHFSLAFLPPTSRGRLASPVNLLQLGFSKHSPPTTSNTPAEEATEPNVSPESSTPNLSSTSDRLGKLQQALDQFNSTAAQDLLSELSLMRQSGVKQQEMDAFLDELLAQGPDRQDLPFWTSFRPLTRFSTRAKWASLRRTLDMTTPPPNPEDEQEAENDATNQQRRRRRALVSLLRTLASSESVVNGPAIVCLEKKAKREQPSQGFFSRFQRQNVEDMTLRRPADLETPNYSVLTQRQGFEIRRYQPFSVCSVSMTKPRPMDSYKTDATVSDPKLSGARAFGALAGYLFGKNQQETAMKMTTPVLSQDQDSDKLMSFVLPSEFWQELDEAPKPLQGSGVTLERVNGQDRAVVMFGGYASKKEVARQKQRLLDALAKDKEWEVVEKESISLAQYNDPFTPPWKRLNEVSVAVKSCDTRKTTTE